MWIGVRHSRRSLGCSSRAGGIRRNTRTSASVDTSSGVTAKPSSGSAGGVPLRQSGIDEAHQVVLDAEDSCRLGHSRRGAHRRCRRAPPRPSPVEGFRRVRPRSGSHSTRQPLPSSGAGFQLPYWTRRPGVACTAINLPFATAPDLCAVLLGYISMSNSFPPEHRASLTRLGRSPDRNTPMTEGFPLTPPHPYCVVPCSALPTPAAPWRVVHGPASCPPSSAING